MSWAPVVAEAQAEQPQTLEYTICTEDVVRNGEAASDNVLRVVEVYANQEAFLVDHRSGEAQERLMATEKENWVGEPQIIKLQLVGGFWGREE
jgi:quinol monooxygenase YgiN